MGNESDDLWATFFLLSYDELLRRACRSVLRAATRANRTYMKSLGWQSRLDRIYELLGVSEREEEKLAIGIARWQDRTFNDKSGVDGISAPTAGGECSRSCNPMSALNFGLAASASLFLMASCGAAPSGTGGAAGDLGSVRHSRGVAARVPWRTSAPRRQCARRSNLIARRVGPALQARIQ